MLFLECNMDVGILKVIMFVKQLLNIVFIAIPIGLIVMLMVDLAKNVMAGSEDDQRKTMKIAMKRVVYAVILFFIPYVVNLAMIIVDEVLESLDISSKFTSCYNIEPDEVKQLAKTQCVDKGGIYDSNTEVCETKNVPKETGEVIPDNGAGQYCRSPIVIKEQDQYGAKKICYYYRETAQVDPSDNKKYKYFGIIAFEADDNVYFWGSDDMGTRNIDRSEFKSQAEKGGSGGEEYGEYNIFINSIFLSNSAAKSIYNKKCPKYMYVETDQVNSYCYANSKDYCKNGDVHDKEYMINIGEYTECKI